MDERSEHIPSWWARGLLFENCNCQLVCPGHVHFDQRCTFERCVGYWAMRFDDGDYGGVTLADVSAVVVYDSPQHMIEGDWTQVIVLDRNASPAQREAVESILTGRAGGPWSVLARFVSRRLETRVLPIRIENRATTKRVVVDGLLDGSIEAIRGRDRSKTAGFVNLFNQIHAPEQVIARGSTRYDDGVIVVDTDKSHALYSDFDWSG